MGNRYTPLSEPLYPKRQYHIWKAFQHLARHFRITFTFNTKGEVGFEREQFMRLMDLYSFLYNSIELDSYRYVCGFRTEYLRPGTHLLSAFILFEDRYKIESRFDDSGKIAWFDSDGFTDLIHDMIHWHGYGGPTILC